ncbi:MAG: hypothetical protein HGA95_01615 [Caldiserica bacterium]|nr:hypothetical protein [Caldisericota bacterium]
MKKILAMMLCLFFAVSCGGGAAIELDSVYPGSFFSFRYPSKWTLTPADAQVTIDFEGSTIAIRFSPLDKAKKNDLSTVNELVDSYKNSVSSKGEIIDNVNRKIGTMEVVWIVSESDKLRSVAFFMPVDGGVYSGTAENIADETFFQTAKTIFDTFEPKSVPVIKNEDPKEDFITHNGVIYSISFPKSWVISGDNPMVIKGKIKHLEINVVPDKSVSPETPANAKVGNCVDFQIGDLKAFVSWSDDKRQATYYVPMHGKILSVKAVGFANGSDPELEKCIGSFRYFENKDMTPEVPKDQPKSDNKPPKPVEQVDIPNPQNAQSPKGDAYQADTYSIVMPKGWTYEEKPASVVAFYPPDKDSGAYFELIVQSYTKSAREVALEMIDAFAPGTPVEMVDLAGTKAAQFTYQLEGYGATVTTVITKGKFQYQLIYNQGKVDLRNEYAAFLKSFEPK